MATISQPPGSGAWGEVAGLHHCWLLLFYSVGGIYDPFGKAPSLIRGIQSIVIVEVALLNGKVVCMRP